MWLCYVWCGQGVRSLWFPQDPGLASEFVKEAEAQARCNRIPRFRKTSLLSFVADLGFFHNLSPRRWQSGSMLGAGGLRVDKAWMSQATVGWGQAGDTSHGFPGVSEICAASCPQLVHNHPPFAHTAPRYARCGLVRLRRNNHFL